MKDHMLNEQEQSLLDDAVQSLRQAAEALNRVNAYVEGIKRAIIAARGLSPDEYEVHTNGTIVKKKNAVKNGTAKEELPQ